MRVAIVLLPGLNRDRDMIEAISSISGQSPLLLWETDNSIPEVDLIIIPGGFSYGDYLRCGAIAARTPILQEVVKKANSGVKVMGVCNGFQILIEAGLLPGVLLCNRSLRFVSRTVKVEVVNNQSFFTKHYEKHQIINLPVAHHDGNYFASPDLVKQLEDEDRIIFKYLKEDNPNGSVNDIAGITNKAGNVLGLMPHPENFISKQHGCMDGRALFTSILGAK